MTFPVKVCGITRLQDARLAAELGARAIGLVFYPASPRYLSVERAAEIARSVPPGVAKVGVFVRAPSTQINRIAQRVGLDWIQLHGGEPHSQLAELIRPGYRAFRPDTEQELTGLEGAPDPLMLLDAYHPDQFGGTGQAFNWDWARRLGARRRVILAGGLRPENAREALETARPAALDLSSGLESAPGIKEPARMEALFRILSEAPYESPSPWSRSDDPPR